MFALIWILLLVILLTTWIFLSLMIINPQEMGVKVFFGEARSSCSSGIRFIPYLPGCYIVKFPGKKLRLAFRAVTIVSKRNTKGERDTLKIEPVVYLQLPQGSNLVKFYLSGVPVTGKEMTIYFRPEVANAFRRVLQTMSWRDISKKGKEIQETVEGLLRGPDSIFSKVGIEANDISLSIKEMIFETSPVFSSGPDNRRDDSQNDDAKDEQIASLQAQMAELSEELEKKADKS